MGFEDHVREVYSLVGISLPLLMRYDLPPREFHLSQDEFALMLNGHRVFFKRKTSNANRFWTHMAIIVSQYKLIHCSRSCGKRVLVTQKCVRRHSIF